MYYFAYGANLNTRGMARRCPAARPVGIAILKDHRLCFKRYADIIPMPGAQVMGVVWTITLGCIRALDDYEGPEYKQITVTVTQGTQESTAMAYAMRAPAALAPPSMDYYRDLATGYREWKLDEALLRRARYDTLNVGPVPQPERNAPSSPLVKRRQALWDPAQHASGSLDELTGPVFKRPVKT